MAELLTKEQILNADDLPKELVSVPEWGGDVYVRTLSGSERDAFEAGTIRQGKGSQTVNLLNLRARLVSLSMCDEQGTRLFGDADMVALGTKSAAALDRVFAVAQRLSKLSDADVEELEGN